MAAISPLPSHNFYKAIPLGHAEATDLRIQGLAQNCMITLTHFSNCQSCPMDHSESLMQAVPESSLVLVQMRRSGEEFSLTFWAEQSKYIGFSKGRLKGKDRIIFAFSNPQDRYELRILPDYVLNTKRELSIVLEDAMPSIESLSLHDSMEL